MNATCYLSTAWFGVLCRENVGSWLEVVVVLVLAGLLQKKGGKKGLHSKR